MPPKPQPTPRPARRKPLTAAEEGFVAEYVHNGGNATRAYLALHPQVSYPSAKTLAARLLTKVDLRNAVRREQRRLARQSGVHAGRVLDELSHVAFSHLGQVLDPRTWTLREHIPPEAWRAVASVQVVTTGRGRHARTAVKVRMHDKLAALDKLARHLGLYRELPPLETVLALLPPPVADPLRAELARGLPTDRPEPAGGAVDDPLPDWARPVPEAEHESDPADGLDGIGPAAGIGAADDPELAY
jgi:phage terminase small subunit